MSKTYYESQQDILDRMLAKSGLSTEEGSTSYIVQSPISIELENIKLEQDEIINRNNIISAYENGYEEEVVKYASQDGIDRKSDNEATGVETFYGTPQILISAGTKFGNEANGLMYETVLNGTIGEDGTVDILSVSTSKGGKYNAKAGTLNYMPIKLVGVTGCTNKADFRKGRDIESIDDLFYRDQLKVRENPNGVNKAQYESWCLEVDGVGSVNIYPLTDETMTKKRGHVCCVITNSERRKADDELCKKVKDYIDPNDGTGEGVAPMNAIVHVISATELSINISFDLTYSSSYDLETVKNNIEAELTDYLKKLSGNKISYTKFGNQIYSAEGVEEYDNLLINDGTDNIMLHDNEIAVMGEVNINA